MAGQNILILYQLSVAETDEVFEIIEIAFTAHADPYDLSGVGERERYVIDAGEGEASVAGEVFHEDEAHLIVSDGSVIAVPVYFELQFPRFRTVVKRLE